MQNNSVFFYRTDNTHSILMPPHRGYDDEKNIYIPVSIVKN